MVATTIILLSIGFATGWYTLLYYLLRAFKQPIFWSRKETKKKGFKPYLLFRALLNLDCIIASIFLGLLTSLTFIQVFIAANATTSSIIDIANNHALIFNVNLFNSASLLSLLNIIITASLMTFCKKLTQLTKEMKENATKAKMKEDRLSAVDIVPHKKDNTRKVSNMSKAITTEEDQEKKLEKSSDKLLLEHGKNKEKDKPQFDIFASPSTNAKTDNTVTNESEKSSQDTKNSEEDQKN